MKKEIKKKTIKDKKGDIVLSNVIYNKEGLKLAKLLVDIFKNSGYILEIHVEGAILEISIKTEEPKTIYFKVKKEESLYDLALDTAKTCCPKCGIKDMCNVIHECDPRGVRNKEETVEAIKENEFKLKNGKMIDQKLDEENERELIGVHGNFMKKDHYWFLLNKDYLDKPKKSTKEIIIKWFSNLLP